MRTAQPSGTFTGLPPCLAATLADRARRLLRISNIAFLVSPTCPSRPIRVVLCQRLPAGLSPFIGRLLDTLWDIRHLHTCVIHRP